MDLKKMILSSIAGILLIIGFVVFNSLTIKEGNTKNTEKIISTTALHKKEDIEKSMDIVMEEFKKIPAVLFTLEYKSDRNALEDIIVLNSHFKTYKKVGSSSGMIPNEDYYWTWTLEQNEEGIWELKSWGY